MLDRLGRALLPPVSMIQFSTYTRVPGSVSIQKLRTVPLGTGSFYGSTGKSHMVAPRRSGVFETCLVLLSFGYDLPLLREVLYIQYVAAPLLVPARGSSLVAA